VYCSSENDSNKSELHSQGTQEQTKFRECLLPYSSESFIFPSAITNSVAQEPEGSSPHLQQPATSPYPNNQSVLVRGCASYFVTDTEFYGGGLSTPKLEDHPLSAVPRLLIQYIHSFPPYLEAVSSIRNPRTCHAVVTVDSLNMIPSAVRFQIYRTVILPVILYGYEIWSLILKDEHIGGV
jgi:hypothetical protein